MIPVKAVLFDYGMVLSGPIDPTAWAQMRSITGLSEELLHRGYWAHRHPYDRGDLTGLAYWRNVATDAGILLTPDQIEALIAADVDLWGQLNLPMLEWAQSLQRAGFPTGILSNIGDAMSAGLLARFDWLAHFNHRVWSHTLNLAKPEAAIYRHAAEGLNTPPANILFIDDRLDNIEAAIAAGMQAIQYHLDHARFEQEMESRGLTSLLRLAPAEPAAQTS
ncbi:HAD family phosphatase [Granulicella sp. dw_53]|uniref:HAD family hydrolase n=1 Tax=Granulicella sp. dw_53 TaxID=2719792 RepID=UPI001BD3ABCA|nr:HAD family phosphatase [Granulicella sp. dw_53]